MLITESEFSYLLHEKLASPVSIIIFSVFKLLTCFFEPSHCWANDITLMRTTVHTLLQQWLLVMDIGHFSYFLDFFFLYLLSRETQCDTHLKTLLQNYFDSPRYYLLSNDSILQMIILTWPWTFGFPDYAVIMIVAMPTYQSACGCVCQSVQESLTICFFMVSYSNIIPNM